MCGETHSGGCGEASAHTTPYNHVTKSVPKKFQTAPCQTPASPRGPLTPRRRCGCPSPKETKSGEKERF